MSLTSILTQMTANRPAAEMVIDSNPPETYGGRVGLKRAATETLKRLRLEYRNQLMASTVFIIVTGSNRDSFAQLASGEEFGCFSTDPEDFYKDLVSRINPSLFGREGIRQLFNIAGNILEDKAMELDIASYPMLMFSEKYNAAVSSVEDFVPVLRNAVNDQVGSEIVGINAVNSIVDRAISRNHAADTTPVILNTSDEKFALDLQNNLKRLPTKVFLVVAGTASKTLKSASDKLIVKNVSLESVGEALESIRNKI